MTPRIRSSQFIIKFIAIFSEWAVIWECWIYL